MTAIKLSIDLLTIPGKSIQSFLPFQRGFSWSVMDWMHVGIGPSLLTWRSVYGPWIRIRSYGKWRDGWMYGWEFSLSIVRESKVGGCRLYLMSSQCGHCKSLLPVRVIKSLTSLDLTLWLPSWTPVVQWVKHAAKKWQRTDSAGTRGRKSPTYQANGWLTWPLLGSRL